jgi:type I restriction-modification system DNA methylase subunit
MRDFNDQARPPPTKAADYQKELTKLISSLAYRHSAWQVFADFSEMAAISMSNAVDLAQREGREARYLEVVKRYSKEEIDKFPQMLAHLVEALEADPSDILGKTFHDLELHNKWAGQFFTPFPVCRMMAKMTLEQQAAEEIIAARGFVRASEPCVGSGAMVIALARAFNDVGINYQQHLHVTAVDIDLKCVHMAYAQLSLLHVPAIVVHGNSLSLEEHSHWYTPAHIMGGWNGKLKRAASDEKHEVARVETPQEAPQPTEAQGRQEEKPEPPAQLTLF